MSPCTSSPLRTAWLLAAILTIATTPVLSEREVTGPYPEVHRGEPEPIENLPQCTLDCANHGYCTFVTDENDPATITKIIAAGEMLQRCVCKPGFTGLTCETEVEECTMPQRKCHNGAPCSQQAPLVGSSSERKEEEWTCDCSYADVKSRFAGAMCRNPATSYCGGGDFKNRSFCTNGGLCLSNLKAFTKVNAEYQKELSTHEGCKCPPEFEGEHCEYLIGMPHITHTEPQSKGAWPLGTFGMYGLVGLVAALTLAVAGIVLRQKRRRRRAAGLVPNDDQSVMSSDTNLSGRGRGEGYRDDCDGGEGGGAGVGTARRHTARAHMSAIEFPNLENNHPVYDDDGDSDFEDVSVMEEDINTDAALAEIESSAHGGRREII